MDHNIYDQITYVSIWWAANRYPSEQWEFEREGENEVRHGTVKSSWLLWMLRVRSDALHAWLLRCKGRGQRSNRMFPIENISFDQYGLQSVCSLKNSFVKFFFPYSHNQIKSFLGRRTVFISMTCKLYVVWCKSLCFFFYCFSICLSCVLLENLVESLVS